MVWNHLKKLAFLAVKTIYQLKSELLSDYLIKELKYPSLKMTLV
jgi:hypothetical protein